MKRPYDAAIRLAAAPSLDQPAQAGFAAQPPAPGFSLWGLVAARTLLYRPRSPIPNTSCAYRTLCAKCSRCCVRNASAWSSGGTRCPGCIVN